MNKEHDRHLLVTGIVEGVANKEDTDIIVKITDTGCVQVHVYVGKIVSIAYTEKVNGTPYYHDAIVRVKREVFSCEKILDAVDRIFYAIGY